MFAVQYTDESDSDEWVFWRFTNSDVVRLYSTSDEAKVDFDNWCNVNWWEYRVVPVDVVVKEDKS